MAHAHTLPIEAPRRYTLRDAYRGRIWRDPGSMVARDLLWVALALALAGLAYDELAFTDDMQPDHTNGVSNTHVVTHGGKLLALVESSYPCELDRELGTVGPHDFDGKLRTSFTAHPKFCPITGEMPVTFTTPAPSSTARTFGSNPTRKPFVEDPSV